MTLKGVDLSHWNGSVKFSGLGDFAIMKATDGVTAVDSMCDTYYQAAKKAGMLVGVYHFYEGGGAKEADWFVKNIKGYLGEALLACDFETHESDVKGVLAFCNRVYALTGVRPVVYTNHAYMLADNFSSLVKGNYGLWYARPGLTKPDATDWGATPALWQYATVGGIDRNIFYGTRATWALYAKPQKAAPPKPAPAKPAAPAPKPAPKPVAHKVTDITLKAFTHRKLFTSKTPQVLPAGEWTTVHVEDGGNVSLLMTTGPFFSLAEIGISGLPVGGVAQVRFIQVTYDKNGKLTETAHYPIKEWNGTTGVTFDQISEVGTLSKDHRLRVQVAVTAAGCKIVSFRGNTDY